MPFTLPQLPYALDAIEPAIDATTMGIHHSKHHNGYVTNLNKAIAGTPLENQSVEQICKGIKDLDPAIQNAVRNNGGGHFNHTLFWSILRTPTENNAPTAELASAIDQAFGSLDQFKDAFAKAGATRFGSGWAWLCVKNDGSLCVCSTPNQDNPLMDGLVQCQATPILGMDVWEHAYYLHYQNRRPDYIAAFFSAINWDQVAANFAAAK